MTPALSTFGDLGEEEDDVKPSMEYLNSLNDYRKRSRSAEEPGRAMSKTPKLNGYDSPHAALPPEVQIPVEQVDEAAMDTADDPVVYGEHDAPRFAMYIRL